MVVTGVRWSESIRRSKRAMVESCYAGRGTRYLHPIIDWLDSDVWAFIHDRRLPYCHLYDEGYKRLGCLFCPMSQPHKRQEQAKKYPKYEVLFRRYFCRLYDNRAAKGTRMTTLWRNGDELFDWWISNDSYPVDDGGLFG